MSANKPEEISVLGNPSEKPQSFNTSPDDDYTLSQFLKGHRLLFIITLLLTTSVFLAYFSNFHGGISKANGDWGTFGDFIGGTLNPIFGFISVVLLFYAVTLQRKELKETKEALQSQSESAKTTTEIQLINAIHSHLENDLRLQITELERAETQLTKESNIVSRLESQISQTEDFNRANESELNKLKAKIAEKNQAAPHNTMARHQKNHELQADNIELTLLENRQRVNNRSIEQKRSEIASINLIAIENQIKTRKNNIKEIMIKLDFIETRINAIYSDYKSSYDM